MLDERSDDHRLARPVSWLTCLKQTDEFRCPEKIQHYKNPPFMWPDRPGTSTDKRKLDNKRIRKSRNKRWGVSEMVDGEPERGKCDSVERGCVSDAVPSSVNLAGWCMRSITSRSSTVRVPTSSPRSRPQ